MYADLKITQCTARSKERMQILIRESSFITNTLNNLTSEGGGKGADLSNLANEWNV